MPSIGNLSTGALCSSGYLHRVYSRPSGNSGQGHRRRDGLEHNLGRGYDPLMGYISDSTPHGGLGSRHPYLFGGAVGIALSIISSGPFGRMGVGARLLLVTAYVFTSSPS
jgi:hypothetical protein